jgi:hypothetical protein
MGGIVLGKDLPRIRVFADGAVDPESQIQAARIS